MLTSFDCRIFVPNPWLLKINIVQGEVGYRKMLSLWKNEEVSQIQWPRLKDSNCKCIAWWASAHVTELLVHRLTVGTKVLNIYILTACLLRSRSWDVTQFLWGGVAWHPKKPAAEETNAQQAEVLSSVSYIIFDCSTRKTCPDTTNVKRVGRPEWKSFSWSWTVSFCKDQTVLTSRVVP